MGTEEEPFEGEVPFAKIEEEVVKRIANARNQGGRSKFVFDSITHPTEESFMTFISQFGNPDFVLFTTCEQKTVEDRWKKKNESEEVPEDVMEGFKAESDSNSKRRNKLSALFGAYKASCKEIIIDTTKMGSIESVTRALNSNFSSKVILVNHETSLPVDNPCANIAIKYNMLYISAYQMIKEHITHKTAWGQRL